MSDMTTQNAIYCMKAMLCEEVCEDCDYYGKTGTDHCEADAIRMAIKALEEQTERKNGKWLSDNIPGGGFWVCSCCKFSSEAFAADVLYKFCPNCGADMRGGQNALPKPYGGESE